MDFVEVEVELNINTPPADLYDDNAKSEDKSNESASPRTFAEMRSKTSELEAELAEVKSELIRKENLIDTQ